MAHFAKIDDNNKVIEVIVADDKEWCESRLGGNWVQTSYNTYGGEHPEGRPLHKNYAGIGYEWDGVGFSAPQPYPSWTKNLDTYLWEPPKPYPADGGFYVWDEELGDWVESSAV